MKARNKKTGEIVTNFGVSKECGTASYIDSTNTLRFSNPLDGEWEIIDESAPIDWDAFRREAAKNVLSHMASWDAARHVSDDVELAISYADELIKQLRDGKK